MRKTIFQVTCVFALSLISSLLWGQASNTMLSGKILNPQGNPIPNATVTVINASTNTSQKVLSAPDGSFTLNNLAPGTYRLEIDAAGFKHTTEQDVSLTAGAPAPLNLTMQAGSGNDNVQVRGHAPAIQSEGGEVSTMITQKDVNELPVIDRSSEALVTLPGGTTPAVPALDIVRDPERNRYYSTNGQDPTINIWEADGLDNTEPFRNTAVQVVPETGIAQMYIATAGQTVEHGYNGGAWVNQQTRSGSNDIHGDLYEYWSGDMMRARNSFNNFSGSSNPQFVYNQFGGDVGAPIVKDRTFIFGLYQGTYQTGDLSQLSTVPVAGALTGNFTGIPGLTLYNPASGLSTGFGRTPYSSGIIPSSQINPASAAIAGFIPAPNLPGFYDNYVSAVPLQTISNKADGRIDQRFGDKMTGFLRYGYTNDWTQNGSPLGNVIGAAERSRLLGQNASLDFTNQISDRLISDFRFGYDRYDDRINSAANESALGSQLGLTNFNNNLIGINIPGLAPNGAAAYLPEHAVDNIFNWSWNWSLQTSHNELRWGTDIRRIRSDGFTDTMFGSLFGPNGTASFTPGATLLNSSNPAALTPYSEFYNSYAAFLLGAPTQFGISNYLATPTIRQTEYSAWVGDRIHPFSRLSLDFGVRYDVFSPLEPRQTGGADRKSVV